MKYHKTTKAELDLILEEGEGYNLEFKQSVNSDLPKEIVAFANASGGRILVGVTDEGKIVGCDISNKVLSPEELGKRSVCRNPLIASLLLRCDYIEKMGTGFGRIEKALKKNKCPNVNIRYNTFFTLEFPRPNVNKKETATGAQSKAQLNQPEK